MIRPAAPSAVDAYLDELAAVLPDGDAARDLLDEVRDHLDDAVAARSREGADRESAERDALRELGGVAELVPEFRTAAVVCDARRQANRQVLGVLLLACWGAAVFHVLPGTDGPPAASAPSVPVTHAAAGALLGASLLLLGLTRTARPWSDARWLAWLVGARGLGAWLFQLGLPLAAATLVLPLAISSGSTHIWILAGAVGGHVVAGLLLPPSALRPLVGALTRRRSRQPEPGRA